MNLQDLLQLQVLKQKAIHAGRVPPSLESALENEEFSVPLRQMCAKVSVELYQDLENACAALDMSKREFIEAAVSDAIDQARAVFEKNGGFKAIFGTDDRGSI